MQNWYIRQDTLCTLETYQKNKGKTGAGDTSKDSKMFSWLYLKCLLGMLSNFDEVCSFGILSEES